MRMKNEIQFSHVFYCTLQLFIFCIFLYLLILHSNNLHDVLSYFYRIEVYYMCLKLTGYVAISFPYLYNKKSRDNVF